MNLQGDKNWNLLKKKIDKISVFIDNSLKTELPLEVTMCLYSKKKDLGQLETLRQLQKHIKP